MLKIHGKLPTDLYLACSGGVDSMAICHFLLASRRKVEILYFNHKTAHGNDAESFVVDFCNKNNIPYHIGTYEGLTQSESEWRESRYNFLSKFSDKPIITCHHLNDSIETFYMSSFKGIEKFIPYRRSNIIRPFLLTSKEDILCYAKRHNVDFIQDYSNFESCCDRNIFRNEIFPVIKKMNPGIETVFRKRLNNFLNKNI